MTQDLISSLIEQLLTSQIRQQQNFGNQNFSNQRQYNNNNSFRQNSYQNTRNFNSQQQLNNTDVAYEQQQQGYTNQNFTKKNMNFQETEAPVNNRTYKQENYGNVNGNMAQQNRPQVVASNIITNMPANTNVNMNAGNMIQPQQQIPGPKKSFAENSIFGKARINLLNATGGNLDSAKSQQSENKM